MAPKRNKQKKKVIGTVLRSTTRIVKETVEVAVFERDTQEDQISQDTEQIDDEPVIMTIPIEEGQKVEIPVQEQETEMAQVKEQEPKKDAESGKSQEQEHEGPETDADKAEKSQEEETSEPKEKNRGRKARSHEGKRQERDQRKKKRSSRGKGIEGEENFRRYVFKVLKQVHPELRISSMGMSIINSLMKDMFERIADEAAKLSQYTHKATLSFREIQDAVKLVLPGELGRHAIAEGSKAVNNYKSYQPK